MKKFIVDTGEKKYIVKAKDAKRAVELVKKIDDAGWFNLTIIELEDSSELTLTKLVKDVKKIVRHRVAEITNGRFDADVLRLQVLVVEDGRTTKFNWMEVPIAYRLSLKALRELSAEAEHKIYKVQSEIKAKLKQFAGKQIYKDKSIATDSFEDAEHIDDANISYIKICKVCNHYKPGNKGYCDVAGRYQAINVANNCPYFSGEKYAFDRDRAHAFRRGPLKFGK